MNELFLELQKVHIPERSATDLALKAFQDLVHEVMPRIKGSETLIFGTKTPAEIANKLTFLKDPKFPSARFTREFNRLWLISKMDELTFETYLKKAKQNLSIDIYECREKIPVESIQQAFSTYPNIDKLSTEILRYARLFLIERKDVEYEALNVNTSKRVTTTISNILEYACTSQNKYIPEFLDGKPELLRELIEKRLLLPGADSSANSIRLIKLAFTESSKETQEQFIALLKKLEYQSSFIKDFPVNHKTWLKRFRSYAKNESSYSPLFYLTPGLMEELFGAMKNTLILYVVDRSYNLSLKRMVALTYRKQKQYEDIEQKMKNPRNLVSSRRLAQITLNVLAIIERPKIYNDSGISDRLIDSGLPYRMEFTRIFDIFLETEKNGMSARSAIKKHHPHKPYPQTYRLYKERKEEVKGYVNCLKNLNSFLMEL